MLAELGSSEQQRARGGRIAWDDFAGMLDRIGEALGTDEGVEEFGRMAIERSSRWAFLHLLPYVVDPGLLLRVGMRLSAPSIFPNMRHTLESRPGGAMRLSLSLPAPYRDCETFFRCCVGGIRSLSTLFGYGPARVVVVSIAPRGCVLDITPPPSRTLFRRVHGAVRALRGDSALFEEIAKQHEATQEVFRVLLRTQSELRDLMERVPEPLVVHRDGVLLWANRAFISTMKCSDLGELRGTRFLDFVVAPDEGAAAARLATPIGGTTVQTFRVRVADGSFRTLELSASQSVTFEETAARMVVARDVTERDALREQLLLADRMSQLGFLAAGVAHEINNPLAYSMLALEGARRQIGAGDAAAATESLTIALEGTQRVRAITTDLRLFTRGAKEHAEPVDLAEVLRATADLAGANIRTRGHVVMDLRPVPRVFADAGRLGQVFMNLLVNALDAVAAGDARTNRIEVRAFTGADGCAVVEIEDNGRGIPPEVAARIFEPFFTTKGPRAGSGLGLALCHRIVSDLGGRIEVGASSGPGTLFRLTLPPWQGEPAPSSAPAPRSARRLRVLVIDDEPPLAKALGRMLEDEHQVDTVTSGEAALSRLEAGADYDAILCDLMMAGLGGMDVHSRLLAVRPDLARRLVFMTGGASSPRAQRFLDEVKNPRLDKPFTRDELIGAMNEVVGGA
jgi:PAS domain S-box-containing protein